MTAEHALGHCIFKCASAGVYALLCLAVGQPCAIRTAP